MRGLKNDKRASNLIDGYVINYNFCRKHQTIKTTPAEAAGLQVKRWKELIENSQQQKTVKEIQSKQPMEVLVENA